MKLFLITTLALSTLCIIETSQPAQADSNFYLARGGGHFGRGEEMMREAPRPVEENRSDMGEGRNQDPSSEGQTSEASRVEDRVHTLSDEAGKGGVTDGGRVHELGRYDNGADLGGVCPEGQILGPDNQTCITPSGDTSATVGAGSGWTTD